MYKITDHKLFLLIKKVIIFGLVIYVFFILGRSIWLNWALKKEIDDMTKQIAVLTEQNRDFENLIIYYQSDTFKELEARSKLGLKKPGETVVSIPVRKFQDYETETQSDKSAVSGSTDKNKDPNWVSWIKYIF